MYKFIQHSTEQLQLIFRNTAHKTELHEAIIEKDFWVCFMLDYLFHQCSFSSSFIFKGGTSLSKCYGLIQRFSEDIDLILDWRILGYEKDEPWKERTNTQQNKFNKEANIRAEKFLSEILLPQLKKDLSTILGKEAILYILPEDPQTICFQYPRIFEDASTLQVIRLEFGALAAWTPSVEKKISSYIAQCYPNIIMQRETTVITAAAERTFWEKATILHHEANRPNHLLIPSRYSRHYYDMYCIGNSPNKKLAFDDIRLLQKVVEFKMKFYPRKWAYYENAVPGTLKLVPPEYRMKELRKDYAAMSKMMFYSYPNFDELMTYMHELEYEINQLHA